MPQIPRIANPSPAQTHAALSLVRQSQARTLGPNPGTQRIRQYQQELANDPRQQQFRETIAHYVRAAEGHLSAMEGRRAASGNLNLSQPVRGAGKGLSPAAAVQLGRLTQAQARPGPTAGVAQPEADNSVLGDVGSAIGSGASGLGDVIQEALAKTYPAGTPLKRGEERAPGATIVGGTLNPEVLGGIPELKARAMADALYQDPVGTTRNTLTSIPQTLSGILTGTARLAYEGTVEGKPATAFDQFGKSISRDANRRYGNLTKPGGVAADSKRMQKEGVLPEALDATIAFGGPAALAGKLLTKGIEATGYGADAAAAAARYREGLTQALQSPHPASVVEPKPSLGQSVRGTIHETAVKPRPNLRTSGAKNETPSVLPGSAIQPQPRSDNFFRGLPQTMLDNLRRAHTQKGLQAAADVRTAIEKDPNAASFLKPPKPGVQPLAHDVKPGEVVPLIQGGGRSDRFPGMAFFGAGRQQRVGTSRLKGQAVEMRRAEAHELAKTVEPQIKALTKQQDMVLVHAKEGTIPLHDPVAATRRLQEIHDQALEGSRDAAGRSMIPASDRRAGSDVAAQTGSVLKYIDKHGPESVFTPQFADAVHGLQDSRTTAPRDSSLSQDALVSRPHRPQVEHLERLAARHPNDPLAAQTTHMAAQIKQLEKEGGDLRVGRDGAGADLSVQARHSLAANKYATAHNLAIDLARTHNLPTDPAYIEHTKRFTEGNLVHTVGNKAPAIQKHMGGDLARKGYRSTDSGLILNGMLKNIRNDYKTKYLKPWHDRFNVAPPNLTAHEAEEWLHNSGRNPAHYEIAHLGRLRASLAEDIHAETGHPHFNLDAQAHAVHTGNVIDQALGRNIPRSDVTKGAGVYPIAAVNELKGILSKPSLPGRTFGKLKSVVSSLMLDTSLPWLQTMTGVTYPLQMLYSGAGPAALREAVSFYHPLSAADKATFDRYFGIDNKFEMSSHGITSERIGATAPKGFEELSRITHLAKQFPLVKVFVKNRPDHIILRMERVPRRYARIAAAYKGVRTQALREMLASSKDVMEHQGKLAMAFTRLQHFGRKPAQEWLDAAMKNQPAMEAHAVHLNKVMGNWKDTTSFERRILGRMILFYPWLRYSVTLALKTLPKDHPLAYATALKYGAIQHQYLHELLGTDPTVGNVYLGPEQPNVAPANRKFSVIGIRQANPLMNTVSDLLGAESPAQLLGVLPPYVSDLLEWAAGKNLFTDKPLKGADKGEPELKPGHRPQLVPFMLNRALQTLSPGRTALKVTGHGMPQSDESLPWATKPVQYSPKTLRKIGREHAATGGSVGQQLLSELLPLKPHSDEGKLATKIRTEGKQAKEQQHKERLEHQHLSGVAGEADNATQALERLESGSAPSSSRENQSALEALERHEAR